MTDTVEIGTRAMCDQDGEDVGPGTFLWDENERKFRAAIAALEKAGIPVTKIASGEMVAVPVEPTDAMLNAANETDGIKAVNGAITIAYVHGHRIDTDQPYPLIQAYRAMLTAAREQADG